MNKDDDTLKFSKELDRKNIDEFMNSKNNDISSILSSIYFKDIKNTLNLLSNISDTDEDDNSDKIKQNINKSKETDSLFVKTPKNLKDNKKTDSIFEKIQKNSSINEINLKIEKKFYFLLKYSKENRETLNRIAELKNIKIEFEINSLVLQGEQSIIKNTANEISLFFNSFQVRTIQVYINQLRPILFYFNICPSKLKFTVLYKKKGLQLCHLFIYFHDNEKLIKIEIEDFIKSHHFKLSCLFFQFKKYIILMDSKEKKLTESLINLVNKNISYLNIPDLIHKDVKYIALYNSICFYYPRNVNYKEIKENFNRFLNKIKIKKLYFSFQFKINKDNANPKQIIKFFEFICEKLNEKSFITNVVQNESNKYDFEFSLFIKKHRYNQSLIKNFINQYSSETNKNLKIIIREDLLVSKLILLKSSFSGESPFDLKFYNKHFEKELKEKTIKFKNKDKENFFIIKFSENEYFVNVWKLLGDLIIF